MRAGTFSPVDYLSDGARDFLARRTAEACGLALIGGVGALSVALATWSIADPSWNHASDNPVHNLLGPPGAICADMQAQALTRKKALRSASPSWGC